MLVTGQSGILVIRGRNLFTSKKRTVIMFIIACSLNIILSGLVFFLHLPMWLDTVGTVYISVIMGSAYGFCVGLVNNVFSTIFYGYNSAFYYIISFFVALISGLYSKRKKMMNSFNKNEKITETIFIRVVRWIILGAMLFTVSGIIGSVFTLLLDRGVPSDYCGKKLYQLLAASGMESSMATVVAVLSIKFIDVIVTLILVVISIRLTPEKLILDKYCVDLYGKRLTDR